MVLSTDMETLVIKVTDRHQDSNQILNNIINETWFYLFYFFLHFILHIYQKVLSRKSRLDGGSLGEFFPRHRLGCRWTWRLVLGGAVHVHVIQSTTG